MNIAVTPMNYQNSTQKISKNLNQQNVNFGNGRFKALIGKEASKVITKTDEYIERKANKLIADAVKKTGADLKTPKGVIDVLKEIKTKINRKEFGIFAAGIFAFLGGIISMGVLTQRCPNVFEIIASTMPAFAAQMYAIFSDLSQDSANDKILDKLFNSGDKELDDLRKEKCESMFRDCDYDYDNIPEENIQNLLEKGKSKLKSELVKTENIEKYTQLKSYLNFVFDSRDKELDGLRKELFIKEYDIDNMKFEYNSVAGVTTSDVDRTYFQNLMALNKDELKSRIAKIDKELSEGEYQKRNDLVLAFTKK